MIEDAMSQWNPERQLSNWKVLAAKSLEDEEDKPDLSRIIDDRLRRWLNFFSENSSLNVTLCFHL